MSLFEPADDMTSHDEGGWANNPKDRGGETWRGIARVFHPSWAGWRIIDTVKAGMTTQPPYGTQNYRNWVNYLNRQLAMIPRLETLRKDFFRTNFWKRLGELDSQEVANYVYNLDVVSGSAGSRLLQRVLGVEVDGDVGNETIRAANAVDPVDLLERFKAGAVNYFDRICEDGRHDDTDKGFARSWLSRLDLPPEQYKAALARVLA